MINALRYAVSFPTNGVSLNGQLSLQPGSTAISGQNGTGKSFIAEMIRYGLFGKKALRGPASDYKTLDMALTFSIGDTEYEVKRAKKEILTQGEEQLAVGADAVNKKIVELLGFDLEVFDVVCAANQKESERLTRLTPTKRKELIDDVVGLTAQEAVEKACRDESRGLAREAEALTRSLVLPTEPVRPQAYKPSADVRLELDETTRLIESRTALQRVIDAVGEEPQKPVEAVGDIEALEAHEKARLEAEANAAAIERQIRAIPDPIHTRTQIKDAQDWLTYDAELERRGRRPEYTAEQVDHFEAILNAQVKAGEETVCPKCDHSFHVGLTAAEEALAAEHSPLTRQGIVSERRALLNWTDELVEPKGARLSRTEITEGTKALDRADEKALLREELARLPELEIKVNQLDAARTRQRQWDVYEHTYEHWRERFDAAQDAQKELAKLPAPKHSLEDLNAAYTAAVVYERELARYDQDKARFDELSAEIAEKQARADAFAAGAKGLVEARRTLKAFLAPSLSRVASKVIREMTANSQRKLEEIIIDDEMNITADGQDVSTFNGAHATMINLALRLALGQVLVARVFPVFIGDEIDSDADAGNAQAIADALNACKEQLKQIVLISHKRLEGVDQEVML